METASSIGVTLAPRKRVKKVTTPRPTVAPRPPTPMRTASKMRRTLAQELLGSRGGAPAIPPLFGVLTDPEKQELHQAAVSALSKLGKPAEDYVIGRLGAKEHVAPAALVLGQLRDPRARAALLRALGNAD